MTKNGLNLIAGLCIIGAVTVALLGSGNADDLLAVTLVGLAGTIAGRGK
jgi:hypothetical protein